MTRRGQASPIDNQAAWLDSVVARLAHTEKLAHVHPEWPNPGGVPTQADLVAWYVAMRLANGLVAVRVYNPADSGDQWVKPDNLAYVDVELVGGGGAGAGAPTSTAGNLSGGMPGHGGGYSRKIILASALDADELVTVGAGGAGASGVSGSAGGTSSFGGHLQATGGGPGSAVVAATATAPRTVFQGSGSPGVGTLGDVNASGFRGPAWVQTSGGSVVYPGSGGASFFGDGAAGSIEANGIDATTPGSGGGGMRNNGAQVARTGGDGGPGLVIVREYYL